MDALLSLAAKVDAREVYDERFCSRFMERCGPQLCDDCINYVADMRAEAQRTNNPQLLELAEMPW